MSEQLSTRVPETYLEQQWWGWDDNRFNDKE